VDCAFPNALQMLYLTLCRHVGWKVGGSRIGATYRSGIQAQAYKNRHTRTPAHPRTHARTHTHTHIHIHTHTHTHTRTHRDGDSKDADDRDGVME
jgi:hypothetical protein